MLKRRQAAYDEWFQKHQEECVINHSGSAGLKEVKINLLQHHYQKAVASKCSTTEKEDYDNTTSCLFNR
ncbi:hypothetical protein BgiMline_031572 [Biomphalaria glabrata]